jgi:uncharacterized delta-60 repeat protein
MRLATLPPAASTSLPRRAAAALVAAALVAATARAADGALDLTFHGNGKYAATQHVAGVSGIAADPAGTIHLAYTTTGAGTDHDLSLLRAPDSAAASPCGLIGADLGGTNADYAYSLLAMPGAGGNGATFYITGAGAGPSNAPHDRGVVGAFKGCALDYGFGNSNTNALSILDVAPPASSVATALLRVPEWPAGLRVLYFLRDSTVIVLTPLALDGSTTYGFVGAADFKDADASATIFYPTTLLRAANGKILVVGTLTLGNGDSDIAVARFYTGLGLDTSYGVGGFVHFAYEIPDDGDDSANGAVLLPDGRLVIGGTLDRDDGTQAAAVAVLTPQGNLDSSFGSLGRHVFNFNDPDWGADTLNALTLDREGRILVAGSSDVGGGSANVNFVVARLHTSGASPLDTTFGGKNGVVNVGFEVGGQLPDQATSIAIDPQGHIIVGGVALTSDGDLVPAMARLQGGLLSDAFESGGTGKWAGTSN